MPADVVEPETRLWQSVVQQAVIDAASDNPKLKISVAQWIRHADFEAVCHMASLIPSRIHSHIRRILLTPGIEGLKLANLLKGMITIQSNFVLTSKHESP